MPARPRAALRVALHRRDTYAWSDPMTTLSNFQNHDTAQSGAWKQATLVLGLLTVVAVIAIMVFAST
jgi:hypothetical protein